MKLRLAPGSIRFRLRQSDVRTLIGAGRIASSVRVGGSEFVFEIELGQGTAEATLSPAGLKARLPALAAGRWADSSLVGLDFELPEGTRLLVEKDFACLELRPGESNDDTFARPPSDAPC